MPLPENILAPIPGDTPGGAPIKSDPVYEKIKEARREDDDLDQGKWTAVRKVADHPLVIRLACEILGTKSKDLQIACWLTESLLKSQGFTGFSEGLEVVGGIVAKFWDGCYPEVPPEEPPKGEEGETDQERRYREDEYLDEREEALELRGQQLEWLHKYLSIPLRQAPVTKSKLDFLKFKESRTVGYEADVAGNTEKAEARLALIAEGKLPAEDWDAAEKATDNDLLRNRRNALRASRETLKALDELSKEKFGKQAPHVEPLGVVLDELERFINEILKQRGDVDPQPVAEGGEPHAERRQNRRPAC